MKCFALHGRARLGNLEQDLDFLEILGLDPEVFLGAEDLDSLDRSAVSRMIRWREAGRALSFHAPFVDLSPAGLDPRVLDVTRHRFRQVMDLAEAVRPSNIIFHPGYDQWRFAFREDLWIENSLGLWTEVLDRSPRSSARILLENVFDARPDHLCELRRRVGGELGFCLDTGHLNLFSEVPPREWVSAFGDGLAELHLHDNDGSRDRHLPVGEGGFDFAGLFAEIASEGSDLAAVLEHHSREETGRSLVNLQHLLDEIFPDDRPRL